MTEESQKTYSITETQLRKFVRQGWNQRAGYQAIVMEPVTIANIDSIMEDAIEELEKPKEKIKL